MSAPQPPPEVRILCILYTDLVASTLRSVQARQAGDEAVHGAQTQQLMTLWGDALVAGGAGLFKQMGDGLLATFNDPLQALRAVTDARTRMAGEPQCRSLALRVALHVGTVTVQEDGDIRGADADLGSRVLECAPPGHVIVSDAYASQVRPYLQPGHILEGLGTFPLKGFAQPVALWSLRLPGETSPATLPANAAPFLRHRALPPAPDAFIGRRRERSDLRNLTGDPVYRCVTLTGMGGSGKTRLALETARDVQNRFQGGVYFVALEDAKDADGILAALAATLFSAAPAALSSENGDAAQTAVRVQNALADRHALLVLDNFEQALADPAAADLVAVLLGALPRLHLLVTSREPLRLKGERVYDLDPLATPPETATLRQLRACESVALFVERVRATDRRFALTPENADDVAALCRSLSGLPLGVEIVAAVVASREMPLPRLRAELQSVLFDAETGLRDVPERQRTLRATFDWSLDRLPEPDRRLLAELSLFETAFGATEARAVCTVAEPAEGLRRLREKSLVSFDANHAERPCRLLVPVREYARLRLGRPNETLRARFVAFFTRRADQLQALYRANQEMDALHGVAGDLENFRTAWNLASEGNRTSDMADLGNALLYFAPLLPRATRLETWLDPTEWALRELGDNRKLGALFNVRARLAHIRDRGAEAVALQRRALDFITSAGSPEAVADAHSTLAFFALRAQDLATAETHARAGIEHARATGDGDAEAVALRVLASVLTPRDPDQADALAERSLALFSAQNERSGMAYAHMALAAIAEQRGDLARAETCYREALRLGWEIRSGPYIVRHLEAIAHFYDRRCEDGDRCRADRLLSVAGDARRALGLPVSHGGGGDAVTTAPSSLPTEDSATAAAPQTILRAAVEDVLSSPLAFSDPPPPPQENILRH